MANVTFRAKKIVHLDSITIPITSHEMTLKHVPVFLSLALLLLLNACKPEPYLKVSPSSLSFSEDGGTQTVQVSANYSWTANVSGTGFSVSPSSGDGDASVTVTAAPTDNPDPVSVKLVFFCEGLSESVELRQEARSTIMIGNVAKIPSDGGVFEVPVQYNTDFSVEVESSAQSWISFVETKALTSGKLVFSVEENKSTDPRTGKVTVKDKSGKVAPVTITLVQEEKKVIEVGDVTEIPAEGGTYEVEIAYNTDFSVEVEESAKDWISFVETKALTSGRMVFVFKENTSPDPRSGKVTIKDKSGKVDPITLTFVQVEKKIIEVGDVTEIPAEGGTFEVEIAYNTEFSVVVEKSAQSWISFVETKALTSGQLVFVFEANEKPDSRTGKVTVKDKSGKVEPITLTFVQKEKKVIEVGDVTEIPQEGGTFEVEIQYNTDFRVEVDYTAQSWITFVETKALTSGRLVFVFEENQAAETRTGTVKILDNDGKVDPITLTFIQAGSEPYFRVVCPEAASLSYEAGELQISIEQNVEWYGYGYDWRDDAQEMFDFGSIRFEWETQYCCKMTIPFSRNNTRKVRTASIMFYGGEFINGNYTYSDTLHVYQQPVTIIASEREVFIPYVASQFSFRVVEDKTDNYRVECDADWIELVNGQEKKGGAEYRWKAKANTGSGMREAQIKVYLTGFDEPDILNVYQEGSELSVSVTYSEKRKQVKAPAIYGSFAEKSTIWWGDGDSMPYSGGASHTFSSSGSHTISVTTNYMHYIERAEVTDLENGMHIDFSKMRDQNE